MDHRDHVELLKPAKLNPGGIWADFGAGSGAFTLALCELIGQESTIYAVDKDKDSLSQLEEAHRARFNSTSNLILLSEDLSKPLDIPLLDGIVMANSLHFFKDKEKMLRHIRSYIKPDGILLVVEYNVDSGNPWVPYPFSFERFQTLAQNSGFSKPKLLATTPSRFLKEFYSAMCKNTGK